MQGESEESKYLDSVLRNKFVTDRRAGFITVNGVCLPQYYSKFEDAIENFQVRDDDVWVCTFSKSGTTWTQEMVWCIANDVDFERSKVPLSERFPFFEYSILFDYMPIILRNPGIEVAEYITDSIRDGTKKPKIVYVTRNAKDTCISYFYYSKLLAGYREDFDDFFSYAPFWEHALGYASRRNDENMLCLTCEDMKADLASVIRKVADFLGKSVDGVYDSKNVDMLINHLSFKSMKANPSVNYESVIDRLKKFKITETEGTFIKTGEKDQWKQEMTREMIDTFDKWILQNTQGTSLVSQ